MRIATSFCRAAARVSSRLATFAQAISRHQGYRSEQHQHRAADVAYDLILQSNDVDGKGAIALVLVANPCGDCRHVRIRLLHRDAVLQTGHQVVVLVTAPRDRVGAERQRQEDVHLTDARDRRHDLGIEQEIRPENTRDGVLVLVRPIADRNTVQRDAGPDDAGIAAEDALPEAVAQDYDLRPARHVVLRQEQPTVQRPRAEQMKQARRGAQRLHALRPIASQQRAAAPLRDRHLLKRPVLVPDVDVLPRRWPVLGNVDPRRPQPEHRKPIGIGIRQRLQQQCTDDTEDRRVGADADRERRDDDDGGGRTAAHHPEGVLQILKQGGHHRAPGGF